jgi:hypothetical protein
MSNEGKKFNILIPVIYEVAEPDGSTFYFLIFSHILVKSFLVWRKIVLNHKNILTLKVLQLHIVVIVDPFGIILALRKPEEKYLIKEVFT